MKNFTLFPQWLRDAVKKGFKDQVLAWAWFILVVLAVIDMLGAHLQGALAVYVFVLFVAILKTGEKSLWKKALGKD